MYAVGLNVLFFGVLRLPWVEAHAVDWLVQFQKAVVLWYGIADHQAIVVNASCSGTDLVALCAGVTLAYPVAWRLRLAGAAGGLGLILSLNMLRIASLFQAASNPARFDVLHLYVWPIVLVVATASYVMVWIRWTDRRTGPMDQRLVRGGLFGAAALTVYAVSLPWAFQSAALVDVGAWTASAGGLVLSTLGASVHSSANVLMTSRGTFQVTPECLFTPVIPLCLAALFALPMSWRRRTTYLMLGVPLFFGLGVARLLVLALPPFVAESPTYLAHGFYQGVAGAALLIAATRWAARREPPAQVWWSYAAVLGITLGVAVLAATSWRNIVELVATGAAGALRIAPLPLASPGEQQGALVLMPGYQLAVMFGLWMAFTGGRAWRVLAIGLAGVFVSQVAFIVAAAGVRAEWGVLPHAVIVRGWAVGIPAALAVIWTSVSRRTRNAVIEDLVTAPPKAGAAMPRSGIQCIVEAHGCDPELLRSPAALQAVFHDVLESLKLTTVGTPMWHVFPGEGGVTGITMLSESHLSVHTYPETGLAAFDLYCCRPHVEWPWQEKLTAALGARHVAVRVIQR